MQISVNLCPWSVFDRQEVGEVLRTDDVEKERRRWKRGSFVGDLGDN